MTLDTVTLSVIEAGLQQVCDEMDLAFSRSAFSPIIAEANDRSDGIYSAEDGSLIAQGVSGLPVFVGVMQYSTRTLIGMIAEGRCLPPHEGDIYIVNDPYLGGTHLMDVRFAMPVFRNGEIFWPHRSNRKACGSRPSSCSRRVCSTPKSTPSSPRTSALPSSESAISRRRQQPFRLVNRGCSRCWIGTATKRCRTPSRTAPPRGQPDARPHRHDCRRHL
jgi:hypothetical protein